MKLNILTMVLFLLCLACKDKDGTNNPEGVVYHNATFITLDQSNSTAAAMWVKDGEIKAIGTYNSVSSQAGNATYKDLAGKTVMPGFHDVHVHPLEASSDNFQFILDENETNPENYKSDIIAALNANPNSTWILGWGYDIHVLLDGNREPIEILDEVSSTKPIAVMELTSHSIWVNSAALSLAGINSSSPDPTGGIIMKDSQGNPNGLLIDNAGNLIIDMAIASIPNSEDNDYWGLADYGLVQLAQNGITSISDARCYWKRNHHLTWQKLETDNLLTVRVNLGLWAYPAENDQSQLASLSSLYSNNPNSLVKVNQIKVYMDGIIHNTTAAMQDDYLIDLYGKSSNNGLNYFDQARLESYLTNLQGLGFDFHIHAIGNRGVNEALNAIDNVGSSNSRHRITHVEYILPSDLQRFATLNVTADAQVAGDFSQPAHWHDNDVYVHSNLNNNIIPLNGLNNASARITLSSDWDVSSLNPFIGIQNAVSRTPENLSLTEALKAYTINGAYVMRQEDQLGSLEVGKLADFIVISANPYQINSNQISNIQVLSTYLEGEKIYP